MSIYKPTGGLPTKSVIIHFLEKKARKQSEGGPLQSRQAPPAFKEEPTQNFFGEGYPARIASKSPPRRR